jgi:hypothetical protein
MDQNRARERIVLSQPLLARQGGRVTVDCALGADRRLHIAIDGPADLLDGVRPDLTAFLPMVMLIAGREGKDVACPGPIDASYLLNLNTSFPPLASAFFGGHSVEVTLKSSPGAAASNSGRSANDGFSLPAKSRARSESDMVMTRPPWVAKIAAICRTNSPSSVRAWAICSL